MPGGGERRRPPRAASLLAAAALGTGLVGCGSAAGDAGTAPSTTAAQKVAEPAAVGKQLAAPTTSARALASAGIDGSVALDGFTTQVRSAPASGSGTALLKAVRVGRHDGFERVVFEFTGAEQPGYRIGWTTDPARAEGSGQPIELAGGARLRVVLQPASGVDMDTGRPAYVGSDRPVVPASGVVVDLVRTGDFESVLTWVVGTDRARPFRVTTLDAPSRVVVDVGAT